MTLSLTLTLAFTPTLTLDPTLTLPLTLTLTLTLTLARCSGTLDSEAGRGVLPLPLPPHFAVWRAQSEATAAAPCRAMSTPARCASPPSMPHIDYLLLTSYDFLLTVYCLLITYRPTAPVTV